MTINTTLIRKLILIATGIGLLASCASDEKKQEPASKSQTSAPKAAATGEFKAPQIETTRLALNQLSYKYTALKTAMSSGKSSSIQAEGSKLLSENPNDPIALNALAIMHIRAGRYLAARLFLLKALDKNPPSAGLLNNLAVVQYKMGEYQTAYSTFRKANQVEQQHARATGNLVTIQMQSGDNSRAQKGLSGTYDSNPLDQRLSQLQAIQYRIQNKYPDARSVYERLIKNDSRDSISMINYATLLVDFMNQPKDGLVLLSKIRFIETERRDILKRVEALESKARKQGP